MGWSASRVALVTLMAAGTGCNDDNDRLAALEAKTGDSTAGSVLRADLDAEIATRKQADADTLASAKAYTGDQIMQLRREWQEAVSAVRDDASAVVNAEISRAIAAEDAIHTSMATIMEPRLVGPGGEDLGRWLAPTTAYVDAITAVHDYSGQDGQSPREVYYTGLNCTGDTYLLSVQIPVGTAISSRTGTMWVTTGLSIPKQLVVSYLGQGGCRATNGNLVTDAQPVRDSKAANLAFTPDQLHLELRPAAR